MKKSTKRIAIGTVLAAALGYVTGLLTAPKSGKETRQDIQDTAIKVKRESEQKLKGLHSDLDSLIGQVKNRAGKVSSIAKKDIDKALKTAVSAKEKTREALSALHEGDSDDKDLKKAIKEAKNAVDHLKKYVTK